jgi:glycogen debranching enzyme
MPDTLHRRANSSDRLPPYPFRSLLLSAILLLTATLSPLAQSQTPPAPSQPLQLSRSVRPWEFLPIIGSRAALFGNESGQMEAWVYPLKFLRDFHLQFHEQGRVLPADSLARTVIVRPESATIVYSSDTFTVRETLTVPVKEPGAIIILDVETEQPLEIEATFVRDFQLEWPAAIGGTYLNWESALHSFVLGEETKKFVAIVGSPTATAPQQEYQTNYSESQQNSFRLGVTPKGRDQKLIVMAASVNGRTEAETAYRHLSSDYPQLLQDSAAYYQDYLRDTVSLSLPDPQLQQAYDWSRISILQGMVTNPYLGTGLVAGYRTSGQSARPGFAWFFGRDSLWTSFALNAEGDFANTRAAIDFVSRFQREDGKIPHEISQTASLIPWFKDFPYGYASADGTPLFIIAMNDYVARSGDINFAKEKWDSVWKAWQFLRSTYDSQGFPQNFGIGHGWVEGGPLLPVKTELYQSGLGAEALRALANLARLTSKNDIHDQLTREFDQHLPLLEKAFWLADKKRYAFALDQNSQPLDEPSVLATVPMWFGLLDESNSQQMITQLADSDHQSDWGMRIISDRASRFSGGGYHYGSVWPLFTGWASVAEYRYHRPLPAYENLRSNALLALDGSLGHVTEVLSGDFYQPLSTSSPHQIWSAAMVVSPLLRGLLGLSADAGTSTLTFAPHLPYDWGSLGVRNLRVGNSRLNLKYLNQADAIVLEAECVGNSACSLDFNPAFSLRAHVLAVTSGGQPVAFHLLSNGQDQHVDVQWKFSGRSVLTIQVRDNFGIAYNLNLPALGSRSRGLRIVSQSWSPSHQLLTLDVAGKSGVDYELRLLNAGTSASANNSALTSVEGGQRYIEGDEDKIKIRFPADNSQEYTHQQIKLHFSAITTIKPK